MTACPLCEARDESLVLMEANMPAHMCQHNDPGGRDDRRSRAGGMNALVRTDTRRRKVDLNEVARVFRETHSMSETAKRVGLSHAWVYLKLVEMGEYEPKRNRREGSLRGKGRPPGTEVERSELDMSRDEEFCALVLATGGVPTIVMARDADTGRERPVWMGPSGRVWRHIEPPQQTLDDIRAAFAAKRGEGRS